MSESSYSAALSDLSHDSSHEYLLVEIEKRLVDLAVELTKRQMLRGYDAVQLAAALTLNETLSQSELPPLTLVAADEALLAAADAEGLSIAEPRERS